MTIVERKWPGETFVCIGTGPSLTQDDVDFCRGKARVIAINNAYKLAPWADVLYACDEKWWNWEKGAKAFTGVKYALERQRTKWPGVQVLRNLGRTGLSLDPAGVKTGHDSGYQAINLAVLFGASQIALIGYDMQGDHYFGRHPDQTRPPFPLCLQAYATLVAPLRQAGVSVVNCSRKTALTAFPRATLADVLAPVREEVAS